MDRIMKTIPSEDLKLFHFDQRNKLIFILCTAILWILAIVAYLTPNFNHWFLANFNILRTNYLFANICYYFTTLTLSFIATPISLLYLASFKFNKLKPYRIVLLLSVMILAIGIPIVDLIKYYGVVPRPWLLYPDINSIYYPGGHSFPSGHAFQAFAGTLPLIICFLTNDETFKRNLKKNSFSNHTPCFCHKPIFQQINCRCALPNRCFVWNWSGHNNDGDLDRGSTIFT